MASHPFVGNDTSRITTTTSKTANNTNTSTEASHNSVLKVVLFCSGNGADVASYRPRRDDSQWWNRRDALVRCVASFLFGPRGVRQQKRELVLLYDGDHCRVHMTTTLDDDDDYETVAISAETRASRRDHHRIVPSEHVIIALWKEAIGKALLNVSQSNRSKTEPVVVQRGELHCWVVLSSTPVVSSSNDGNDRNHHCNSTSNDARRRMIQDWSKRQLLEYLQKECSMDFLREHKLNSNPAVLLRKTNRGALTKVYHHWLKTPSTTNNNPILDNKTTIQHPPPSQKKLLQSIFEQLLEVPNTQQEKNNNSLSCSSFIAATLHESSDGELPCFGPYCDNGNSSRATNLCLFLGAVRDMIPIEYEALAAACRSTNSTTNRIPLVQVRLGSVPEFTSKILSVVAFHHSQGKLGPAMQRLVKEQKEKTRRQHDNDKKQDNGASKDDTTATRYHKNHNSPQNVSLMTTPELHILGLVPLRSDQVVMDLDQRDRTLWCIVRVLVSSLWRSRFAASSSQRTHNPLNNVVTLVFLDGTYITLRQKEWVSSLAEQHQAAPSEYQVLKALIERIQECKSVSSKSTPVIWEQRVPLILDQLLVASDETTASSLRYVINLQSDAASNLTNNFYKQTKTTFSFSSPKSSHSDPNQSIWALLPIASTTSRGDDQVLQEVQKAFLRVFDKDPKWNVSHQSVLAPIDSLSMTSENSCGDWEASSITMLQHFIYQDRLFIGQEGVLSKNGKESGKDGENTKDDSKKRKKKRKDKKEKKGKKKRKRE